MHYVSVALLFIMTVHRVNQTFLFRGLLVNFYCL